MAPVWAPNPAVPVAARVLAYLFGALMIVTVLVSLYSNRPPDRPHFPQRWQQYRSAAGVTVPYPDGWAVTTKPIADGEQVYFSFTPGGLIQVELLIKTLPGEADEEIRAYIRQVIDEQLRQRLPAYTSGDTLSNGLHSFTFRMDTGTAAAMTGAWRLDAEHTHAVRLLAVSPTPSWPALAPIVDHMLTNLRLPDAPPQP